MGYIYAHRTDRLLCDCCSKEGAHKRACPCGYCPAALNADNLVHVLFENNRGETIGKLMTHDTYDAISLLEPATVEDYAKIGALMDGPSEFDFGGTSKRCEAVFA